MDIGKILKWVLIILIGWFALQWVSNTIAQFAYQQQDIPGGEVVGNPWAPPLPGPMNVYPVYGNRSRRIRAPWTGRGRRAW